MKRLILVALSVSLLMFSACAVKQTPPPAMVVDQPGLEAAHMSADEREIAALQKRVEELTAENEALRQEIEQLKRRLRANEAAKTPSKQVDLTVPATAMTRGSADAPVKLVVFMELLCPFCARHHDNVKKLQEKFGDDNVQIVYLYFRIHPGADFLQRAALAAGRQGKFWKFIEIAFANMGDWKAGLLNDDMTVEQEAEAYDKTIRPAAAKLGLDADLLFRDMQDEAIKKQLATETQLGRDCSVRGTPTSVINGDVIVGARPYEEFEKIVAEMLKE
ncbi:MAG TPA: DsbA family protein [bacterium]|nr:DsbA family protein [bacterium]